MKLQLGVMAHLSDGPDVALAKVAEDRVASRVGSRFSDVRDVIQVRLHRGEENRMALMAEFRRS